MTKRNPGKQVTAKNSKVGDRVAAVNGNKEITGYGVITSANSFGDYGVTLDDGTVLTNRYGCTLRTA